MRSRKRKNASLIEEAARARVRVHIRLASPSHPHLHAHKERRECWTDIVATGEASAKR